MRTSPVFLVVSAVLIADLCGATPAIAGWQLQSSGTTNDLHSVNFDHSTSARAWACGENGTILYTSDGGASWTQQVSGTTADLYGIVFHEENGSIIAVGEHGTILRSTNRGTTWLSVASPTSNTLHDTSDFRFYAVGDGGTIVKSTDLGVSWFSMESGTTADLRSVHGLEPFPTAVGAQGIILRAQGAVWQQMNSNTTLTLDGLPLFQNALVAGENGTILKSSNFGTDWVQIASGVTHDLRSIGDANGAIYIAGAGGTILVSTNNGASLAQQVTPTTEDLEGIFFYLFESHGYAVGHNGTILATTDGGESDPTGVDQPVAVLRNHSSIDSSQPNPFTASTSLHYTLASSGAVSLKVYDASGREVSTLLESVQPAGRRSVTWNPAGLPSGTYYARLSADANVDTRLITLIR